MNITWLLHLIYWHCIDLVRGCFIIAIQLLTFTSLNKSNETFYNKNNTPTSMIFSRLIFSQVVAPIASDSHDRARRRRVHVLAPALRIPLVLLEGTICNTTLIVQITEHWNFCAIDNRVIPSHLDYNTIVYVFCHQSNYASYLFAARISAMPTVSPVSVPMPMFAAYTTIDSCPILPIQLYCPVIWTEDTYDMHDIDHTAHH